MGWASAKGCPRKLVREVNGLQPVTPLSRLYLGGGLKYFFIFTPVWGNDPF